MDTSAAAQINAIEATFNDLDGEIRHPDPAKSHLRVAQVRVTSSLSAPGAYRLLPLV